MAILGNLIEQVRGVSYKPEDLRNTLDDDSIILLRANNIKDGLLNFDDVVYVDKRKVSEKQLLRAGDILICASSGSKDLVGKAAYVTVDVPMTFGAFCKVIRPKTECPQYIGHFFNSPYYRERIANSAAGANINNIRNEHIDFLEIKWLSLEERYDVVEVLDNVSKLIALRKEQLAKLDQLVKSRFIELFGDIHEPSKWDKKPWSEVVTIQNGRDYKNIIVESGGYPVYGTGGEMARASDYLCPENTIIVGRKGTINNPLLVKEKFWNVDTAFGVIVGNQLHYQYFYNFCRMFDFSTLNKQAVLPSTTKADLLKIEIAVPPMELQEQFANFVEQTDKSKLAIQQSLDKLELLKKSLMQEYFG